jgi:hypothetical protein
VGQWVASAGWGRQPGVLTNWDPRLLVAALQDGQPLLRLDQLGLVQGRGILHPWHAHSRARRLPRRPLASWKFQGKKAGCKRKNICLSHRNLQRDQLQTCRALCWDGRRREGLLRRGLGGREHRNQPQVRRPRRHEPTRSTAHTHAHTRTHARARTHAHAHHTPNARTGRATCCSSTSDA